MLSTAFDRAEDPGIKINSCRCGKTPKVFSDKGCWLIGCECGFLLTSAESNCEQAAEAWNRGEVTKNIPGHHCKWTVFKEQ